MSILTGSLKSNHIQAALPEEGQMPMTPGRSIGLGITHVKSVGVLELSEWWQVLAKSVYKVVRAAMLAISVAMLVISVSLFLMLIECTMPRCCSIGQFIKVAVMLYLCGKYTGLQRFGYCVGTMD